MENRRRSNEIELRLRRLLRILRRDAVGRGNGHRRNNCIGRRDDGLRWRGNRFSSGLRPRARRRFETRRQYRIARLRELHLFLHFPVRRLLRARGLALSLPHLLLNIVIIRAFPASLCAHGRAAVKGESERNNEAKGRDFLVHARCKAQGVRGPSSPREESVRLAEGTWR